MTNKKVAIIGSGPAGLTAAIYTARSSLDTTIFMGSQPGGQLTTTTEIENFPGAWDDSTSLGLMGPKLMSRIQAQAAHFGAKIEFQDIKNITQSNSGFSLESSFGDKFDFEAIIVATGASARYLGLPEEEKWVGRGYHTCATCDGFFYKDRVVAVVGGGDSAMEEANYLAKLASKVYVIHRRDEFKASKIMLMRAQNNSKIEFKLFQNPVDFLIVDNKITGLKLQNTQTQELCDLQVDGIFVAIGHTPNSTFTNGVLKTDDAGYLLSRSTLLPAKIALGEKLDTNWAKYGKMSEIPGIFIAGDVEDKVYRQAISAAGDGCRAAIDCERWLEESAS